MDIPKNIKIFSLIYEYRFWLFILLALSWIACSAILLFCRCKIFLVVLALLPLALQFFSIATVWSGWHYRMELRNRFAKVPNMGNAIDIDRMPPAIRAEYARHDYRPRFSDVKQLLLWNILLLPATCQIPLAAWIMYHKNGILNKSQPSEPT